MSLQSWQFPLCCDSLQFTNKSFPFHYKSTNMGNRHLPEDDRQSRALKEFSNLQSLGDLVDRELFRPVLEELFGPPNTSGRGRRSWDCLVIFRCLMLGVVNGLSDEKLQYMLLDRTSFKQCAGLATLDQVPDRKTLWKCRNMLGESGRIDELVGAFKDQLLAHGHHMQTGSLVGSSPVRVPRRRTTREENATIRDGSVPEEWEGKGNKLRQKDVDARWFRKNGVNHYGCRNHVAVDRETRLITNWDVTPANEHDSRVFGELPAPSPRGDPQVFADSACRSKDAVAGLWKRGYRPRINFKGKRGVPLTPRQKALNRCHSRVRCRVGHVFGAIGNGTNTRCMNCIGIRRSRVWIGLVNLCCNMKRFEYLERAEAVSWGESCHNGPNGGRGVCQDAELGWFGL